MTRLTDESYSFHTFQLTKSLNLKEYGDIKNTIFSSSKVKKFRAYFLESCLFSEQYKRFGVLIKLYENRSNPPHINNFFPEGHYSSYQDTKEAILNAPVKRKIRKRMLILIKNASCCDNLNNALAELQSDFRLNDNQVGTVLRAFQKLNVNPVTLPNRSVYTGLQGIHQLFETAENVSDN